MAKQEPAKKSDFIALALLGSWLVVTMLLWWFALYRTSEVSPEWLQRAQAVCFGTDETGLPDTYGWWVLILAPITFLLALIVTFGNELRVSFLSATGSSAGKLVVLGAVVLAIVEISWATGRVQDGLAIARTDYGPLANLAWPDTYPRTEKPAPPFALIDQSGNEISLQDLRGQVTILTFAFAHCTTVCPVIVDSTQKAFAELPVDDTRLVVITLDPWRDTPSSLPTLAEKWGLKSNSHVLSGKVPDVVDVIKRYELPTEKDEKTGDITHPALVFVIDQDLRIAYTFNNPSSTWLKQAVGKLLQQDSKGRVNG